MRLKLDLQCHYSNLFSLSFLNRENPLREGNIYHADEANLGDMGLTLSALPLNTEETQTWDLEHYHSGGHVITQNIKPTNATADYT